MTTLTRYNLLDLHTRKALIFNTPDLNTLKIGLLHHLSHLFEPEMMNKLRVIPLNQLVEMFEYQIITN